MGRGEDARAMWRMWTAVGVMVAVGLGVGVGVGWAGTRAAESSPSAYTLCSSGAGKPFVSPVSGGKCKAGQKSVVLASAGALSSLKTEVASLKSRVGVLEQKLIRVSYSARGLNHKPTLKISGANLQVVSGSGHTNGKVNGLGNVIIGYDESPGTQTGSNNLVLGEGQSFSRYGDVIGGEYNTATGRFADVFGFANTVSGDYVSVSGGAANTASGESASVSGGNGNTASGDWASVGGGGGNTASGDDASVSGGFLNVAADAFSSVVGGCKNATGTGTPPSGTCPSSGIEAILGGLGNGATGVESSVSGGYDNYASGGAGSVLGGESNTASGPTYSSVLGGKQNNASSSCQSIPVTPVAGTC